MSIAVSTVVYPSRLLAVVFGSVCMASACLACLIALGFTGNFSPLWRAVIVLALSVIPVLASSGVIRNKNSLHIDISYNGQIKVEEDKALAAVHTKAVLQQERSSSEVVKLMPNSTIWTHLLLLRLQAKDRKIRTVLILPDCMSANSFRALSVACRWIAAHNDHA